MLVIIFHPFIDKIAGLKLTGLINNCSVGLEGRSYADSSEVSYTTTLSYTTDTILPGLGLGPGSLRGVLRITKRYVPSLKIWMYYTLCIVSCRM